MFVNRQAELAFLNDVLARKRLTAAQFNGGLPGFRYKTVFHGSQPPSLTRSSADLVYNTRYQEAADEGGNPRIRAIPEPSVSR